MREKAFLTGALERLGIPALNKMQEKMLATASANNNILLLSPTGSGKTLAFALAMMKYLNPPSGKVQCVIIAPSRELVIQIASVVKAVAVGFKVTALYGGHSALDETNSLAAVPDIIVATPGRMVDHLQRRNVDPETVRILILDEFDKSLELGFEEEMKKIVKRLKNVSRIILTSATNLEPLPDFMPLSGVVTLNFLDKGEEVRSRMKVIKAPASGKDKLESLGALLSAIVKEPETERSIVFVNHRESAERVADFLEKKGFDVVLYHGALDQKEREKGVALFMSGAKPVMVATDLASRGLDIDGVKNVIHYHLPLSSDIYTHRNGRTARVDKEGDIYLLTAPEEEIPDFVSIDETFSIPEAISAPVKSRKTMIYINAGRKEKLSKGDILGFLTKEAGLEGSEIGKIFVYDHYSLVTVPKEKCENIIARISSSKLKGEKRRAFPAYKSGQKRIVEKIKKSGVKKFGK